MSLDALLLRLQQNSGVTRVTRVTPSNDAGFDCNPGVTPRKSGVTTRGEQSAFVTPVTPCNPATGYRKTLENQACNPCNPCNPTKIQNRSMQDAGARDLKAWEPRLAQSLEMRVRAMARRWGYSSEELAEVLELARRKPEDWLRLVEADERMAWPDRKSAAYWREVGLVFASVRRKGDDNAAS